jgi:hypothetical protein
MRLYTEASINEKKEKESWEEEWHKFVWLEFDQQDVILSYRFNLSIIANVRWRNLGRIISSVIII